MGDFHTGGLSDKLEYFEKAGARVYHTPIGKKMLFYGAGLNGKVYVGFTRYGLTNFAKAEHEFIKCTEQFFTLGKTTSEAAVDCPNAREIEVKMLCASTPNETKDWGRKLTGFDTKKWDQEAPSRMMAARLFSLLNKDNFEAMKEFATTTMIDEAMRKSIEAGDLYPIELNKDDSVWGWTTVSEDVLKALDSAEEVYDFGDFIFGVAMSNTTLKPHVTKGGKNQLGKILGKILCVIQNMTYEHFVKLTDGVEFYRIIEDSNEEGPAVKKACV